ncbi:hypothetical protein EYB26_004252 [Talaromyces marneffei]|uniref:uncharacterized protein n=1 Tax=Talaromyces marneffei TaxID=37727 RepID=UPI0012A98222|nr:uncharacterized protein EYB26_004252 [Talaromyces marneffei]QGA16585.1 hypothetical protein EYB26_004252 [Talaromyces marneffei]
MATPGGTPNQAKKPHTKTPAKTPAKQKVKKANAPKTPGSRKGFGNHGWKRTIIILLEKLGEQQFNDLSKLWCVIPVLLTSNTKQSQPGIMKRIEDGDYTHILVGPELATKGIFPELLRLPKLGRRIGLVAIDECHLISQWSGFRNAFLQLGILRDSLRQDVVWLGCSATVTKEVEGIILDKAGFHEVSDSFHQTEIIQVPIDRDDIFFDMKPIPRVSSKEASPQNILKTIIFVENISDIIEAYLALCNMLFVQTAIDSTKPYLRYGTGELSVRQVIRPYHSHLAKTDKDLYVKEFMKKHSTIRIMIATNALGIGIDLPDVDQVVCWKFLINFDIYDLFQKAGRAARGQGRTGRVVMMFPYWAFVRFGIDENDSTETNGTTQKNFKFIHVDPSQWSKANSRRNSQSSTTTLLDDISDTESVRSTVRDDYILSHIDSSLERRTWNWNEKKWRAGLAKKGAALKKIINNLCHRDPFLSPLGQNTKSLVRKEDCCNRCNLSRSILDFIAPQKSNDLSTSIDAKFAFAYITRWAI